MWKQINKPKTPSQRLRGALFRLWEQEDKPTMNFELWYQWKMERYILEIKKLLTKKTWYGNK